MQNWVWLKPSAHGGCLTVLGISAGHVVVGFDEVECGADHGLKGLESGAGVSGHASADLRAGDGERVERRQGIAHHRVDIERAEGLIQGPEGFGTIGVERGQVREGGLREIARGEAPLIERAQAARACRGARVRAARADRPASASREHGRVGSRGDLDEPQLIGPRPLAVEQ